MTEQTQPTVVFVFELKQWYSNISAISKLDLLDIVPHVSVQFGFDYKNQAYLMILTKSKWIDIPTELKTKFMGISRRIKEEIDGPMNTAERELYENTDFFAAFDKKDEVAQSVVDSSPTPQSQLESVPEASEAESIAEAVAEFIAEPDAKSIAETVAETLVEAVAETEYEVVAEPEVVPEVVAIPVVTKTKKSKK
jgi:hypothetical protein